jgi:hypothetical protein
MYVIEEFKRKWKLVVFFLVMTGVLVAYSISNGRYLVLVLWIILPASNYIYKKYFKKGY